jgi:hypothetical protein
MLDSCYPKEKNGLCSFTILDKSENSGSNNLNGLEGIKCKLWD